MDTIRNYVGLDYHQSGVQVCAMDQSGRMLMNQGCPNHWEAISTQVERFGKPVHAAIESCSGAANLADELVHHAGWHVDLAHPGYVAKMKQNPDKSDFSDARLLADLERVGYLPRVWLAPVEVRELRMLVRYRQQLVNQRRAVKLRVGALLREQRCGSGPYGRWSRPWLWWLENKALLSEQGRWVIGRHLTSMKTLNDDIHLAENRLQQACQQDALVNRLLGLKGIGYVTAWTLRAEIGRFDRFRTGKQLSRFCGLSPRNASSGTRQADAGLIMAANGALRTVLIEAAHRLIRCDERWKNLAAKLLSRGKPKSAVANRWCRWLFRQMMAPVYA